MTTESKLRENVTVFTDQRKDLFSSNFAQQLGEISSMINEQQRYRLQSIAVAGVVNDVTNKVVENVVREGLALNRAAVPSLHLLTREAAAQLVGKPIMVKEAAKKIDDQLFDLAAATYASEIAEAILIAIIPTQPAVEGQKLNVPNPFDAVDSNLKELVSVAALAASPMRPSYDSTGIPLRRTITMQDAGSIIMAGAPFFGPDAPLVFLIGDAVYLM